MKFKFLKTLLIATSLFVGAFAKAALITSLSGNSYIDDRGFIAISTNDFVRGTTVASTTFWNRPANFSGFTLLADVDYFIHIFVKGGNFPNNIIGEFNIDGTTHEFANGTQTLGTNKVDWLWGTSLSNMVNAPVNVGDNFAGSFDSTSENIFRANKSPNYINTNAFFTTNISAVQLDVSSVPEPSTLAILGLGLIGLVSRRFKK
jgi:hypothetical protein